MSYHGDIRLGDTIDIKFTTRAFATGQPATLDDYPAVSAYVGNNTTEIVAGITLTTDFDGRVGLNHVRVVASSGNGFATATNVELVLTSGEVDGTPVAGEVVASFSIENRSALMPTVAAKTLDVTNNGNAGIDWGNIDNPTTAQNLSATNIDTDQVVASVSGAVGSVTGAVGSVTGAVGSVTGNVGGNVVGSVGSVVGDIGGDVLGNVDGSVGSVVGLNPALLDAAVSTRATPAQVNTEVNDVINVDTKAELSGVPASNASLGDKITFVQMKIRNEETQDATTATIANNAGTPIASAPVSDDGTTFTKGKYA